MDIKGLGVLVTGGGSGLGEATARAFAAKGAHIAILDLAKSQGAAIAKELGGKSFFAECDVTSGEQAAAAIDKAAAAFAAIHVVVNCAGIGTPGKVLGKDNVPLDLEIFRRVVEINLIGTFNVIRLAAAKMVKNEPNSEGERGVFINTASVAAYDGQIGQPAYSASKGGVVGMTLPIAREFAREGIRCVTIAPGLFETPMLMGLSESARKSLGASVPFPARLGRPTEYASLACYIVETPMLNGETIRFDGAIRMAPR